MDIFETAEYVYLGVCQYDARPAGILNRKFGLAVLACYTSNGSAEMLALERLDVLDLKGLDVKVI